MIFNSKNKNHKIINKSDWIASITTLNGVLNGTNGPHGLDPNPYPHNDYPWVRRYATGLFKLLMVI